MTTPTFRGGLCELVGGLGRIARQGDDDRAAVADEERQALRVAPCGDDAVRAQVAGYLHGHPAGVPGRTEHQDAPAGPELGPAA